MITRSLFFRQLISHIGIIIFMALTLSGSVLYYAYQGKNGDLDLRVNNIAAFFAEDFKSGHLPNEREWQLATKATDAILWLEDNDGQIIHGTPPDNWNKNSYKLIYALDYSKQLFISPKRQNSIVISVPIMLGDSPGKLFAYYSDASRLFDRILRFYLFPFMVGVLTAFLLAFWVSRKLTHSIADIAAAAKQFSAGDYLSRTRFTGNDEIGQLGKTFNAMAESILYTQQTRRNFFANVSHELKTPLSCVKVTAEALIDGIAANDKERTQYLEKIVAETDRMSRLVHDITDTEQLESGKMFIKQERLDLKVLLCNQADKLELLLKKKNLSLLLRLETNRRYVLGDGDRLEQVLDNLLSNAIRHTPPGSRIGLSLTEEDKWLQICVSDQGEGIAEEELPLIWERFYRADKSRNRSTGGSGLGLSISRGLVEAMGGTISAQSKKGEGATFIIRLPGQK